MRTGMAHWLSIWTGKASQDPASASGRSGYGAHHLKCLLDDAISALALKPHDTLLDVGCAQGFMGEELRTCVSRYVGVDAVLGMLAAFQARCPGVQTIVASATDLGVFRDGEFTKTLLSSVLLVLSREEGIQAIRELRRVTASGGRAFISGNVTKTWDKSPYGTECEPDCRCYAHVTAWPPELLIPAVLEAGWTNPQPRALNPGLSQSEYQWDLLVEAA